MALQHWDDVETFRQEVKSGLLQVDDPVNTGIPSETWAIAWAIAWRSGFLKPGSTQEVGWSQGMLLKKIHLRSFKIGALESFSSWNATHQVVQPLPSNHGICCPAAQRASIFGGSVSWAPNGNLWNGSIQVHPCFANGIGRLGWTHPSIGSTIIAGKRMSNGHNYCNTNLVLLRLGLSEVAQNLHNR